MGQSTVQERQACVWGGILRIQECYSGTVSPQWAKEQERQVEVGQCSKYIAASGVPVQLPSILLWQS